jgi:hypothetical protein
MGTHRGVAKLPEALGGILLFECASGGALMFD